MSQRGIDAMLIASVWMAVMAFAVAISAAGLTSTVEVIYRVLVALGFMGLSSIAFWMAAELRRDEEEAPAGTLAPVRVRGRDRSRR